MQFGPMTRTPERATADASSSCSFSPSGPVSEKPDVITTAPPTPLAPHSSITPGTNGAGTTTTTRSTASGRSVTDG